MLDQKIDVTQTRYYRQLAQIKLKPLMIYMGVVLVGIISLIVVFYLRYLPSLLLSVETVLPSQELLAFLEARISKIVVIFSVLFFVLFLLGVKLVQVVWNVEKLLAHLEKNERL